jgi:hypothetical protein
MLPWWDGSSGVDGISEMIGPGNWFFKKLLVPFAHREYGN